MAWFWWWLLFVLLLVVLPVGYGWGYQRRGPPAPYWVRRSRARRARVEAVTWGLAADAIWLAFTIALVWVVVAALTA